MLTRKHFQELAEMVQEINDISPEAANRLVELMLTFCRESNPRFDATRFVNACFAKKEEVES